ncbi:MAG: hypothetical protein ABI609_11070 [Acidobacteriota bacterium]
MSTEEVPRTLAEEVLVPGNQKLQLLAAQGLLPLPPDELLPIQIALAQSSDGEVAEQARASLGRIDPRIAAPYLAHQASSEALAYFAFSVHHPVVQEAIIRRRDVPWMLLEDLAARISPDLQEALLVRQDAIIEHPAILDSLANNPNLSSYSRRRISEYRQHLLPRAAIPSLESEIEEANDAEVAAAIASVQDLPTAGEVDDQTGLSEAQVRQLPLPVRLRLTRGASRSLRSILVRDANALVALSVINNNPLSDQEVEHIARNRSVCEEVLVAITRRREWMRKYPIIQALVGNPRTPPGNSVKLLPMLSVRDLRNLAKDKNVSDLVRRTATRLYKIKQV